MFSSDHLFSHDDSRVSGCSSMSRGLRDFGTLEEREKFPLKRKFLDSLFWVPAFFSVLFHRGFGISSKLLVAVETSSTVYPKVL